MGPDGIETLLDLMKALRDPERGCPWDRQQTFRSIAPYTLEEAYEVADAIGRGDLEDLKDELGDLLFQVVFHSRMAEEAGAFGFGDVVQAICAKMHRRHPHVFAGAAPGDLREAWAQAKAAERSSKTGTASLLTGVALALPALARAEKLQKRAAQVGFDWDSVGGVLDKVREELAECQAALPEGGQAIEREIGDLLFSCVNLARHLGVDAEQALRGANGRFERRFRFIEARLAEVGLTPTPVLRERMEALWELAKRDDDYRHA